MNDLVSIITPALYSRKEVLLNRNIPSVMKQTHKNWEHLVITDGPCPLHAELPPHIKYYELGKNWSFLLNAHGHVQTMVGSFLAQGNYIAYIDDDDAWYPDHLESLLDLIKKTKADFVYSKMETIVKGEVVAHVFANPPRLAGISTSAIMHKIDTMKITNWGPDCFCYPGEWKMTEKWIQAGLKWAGLDRVTVKWYRNKPWPG